MSRRKPTIRRGPASGYAGQGEAIYDFGDGESGGLIAIQRAADGRLVVDLYRMDADVIVRAPREHLWTGEAIDRIGPAQS